MGKGKCKVLVQVSKALFTSEAEFNAATTIYATKTAYKLKLKVDEFF